MSGFNTSEWQDYLTGKSNSYNFSYRNSSIHSFATNSVFSLPPLPTTTLIRGGKKVRFLIPKKRHPK